MEYVPTEKYREVYREALGRYAKQVADAVGVLADKIIAARGKDVVLAVHKEKLFRLIYFQQIFHGIIVDAPTPDNGSDGAVRNP